MRPSLSERHKTYLDISQKLGKEILFSKDPCEPLSRKDHVLGYVERLSLEIFGIKGDARGLWSWNMQHVLFLGSIDTPLRDR